MSAMDVLVATTEDGWEMHVTRYEDEYAWGYLQRDEERLDLPYPLATVLRNDPGSWDTTPAMDATPVIRERP